MKIPLTKNYTAIIDDEDFDLVAMFKWHAGVRRHGVYALTTMPGCQIKFGMHNLILPIEKPFEVDHINGNKLDNRRSNLRVATRRQNSFNRGKSKGTYHSKFKGVTFCKKRRVWLAQLYFDGKNYYLGSFDFEAGAAAAYDKKASEVIGRFFKPNLKKGDPSG